MKSIFFNLENIKLIVGACFIIILLVYILDKQGSLVNKKDEKKSPSLSSCEKNLVNKISKLDIIVSSSGLIILIIMTILIFF